MLKICNLTIENLKTDIVTDNKNPQISFYLESDKDKVHLEKCHLLVKKSDEIVWEVDTGTQTGIIYSGKELVPETEYEVCASATDNYGEKASAQISFMTGLMGNDWVGEWITDGDYTFTENKVSPEPMVFRKSIKAKGKVKKAYLYATALGLYQCSIDGKRVGKRYFAPGFTSYKNNLQYQQYDVTDMMSANKESLLEFTVTGGWAVGSFIYSRKNRFASDKQALKAQLHLIYDDNEEEVIGTDASFDVTRKANLKMADLYDGELYDSTVAANDLEFKKASVFSPRVNPRIYAECGSPVTEHEVLKPVSVVYYPERKETVYDFGQNMAGVIRFNIKRADKGQKVIIRHAEILNPDGSLNTAFLRSAQATITYICSEGKQSYCPTFTYMGFRYASVSGLAKEDIELEAVALYSDITERGNFSCSNEMLNKLQENIKWGAKSNFVEIPTDCPQRDERMGWTGDIAVFADTACFNFDMGRFLRKWLKDVRSEQLSTGGLPNTVPANGFGFPVTMPTMAIDWWGDAAVLVPWALYRADGDINVLKDNYEMMKKYVNACKGWASLFSVGKHRYIWNTPSTFHFGDWVAPDVPKMQQWQKRSKWTATASLCNTSDLLSRIAGILGYKEDEIKYKKVSDRTKKAYEEVFTDGKGKLLEEFQTAYVLPLYFDMFSKENKKNAVDNLARLVEKNDYCIGTGFPGTPYILFALCDNGRSDVAYKMLLNTKCPSWLYEVRVGATTIWERWDGLDENGLCPIGDDGTDKMISYNHYASGAVGAFLYKRVAGIEEIEPGYKKFRVKPVIGGDITNARAEITTAYGKAGVDWKIEGNNFHIKVTVPVSCSCTVELPDGAKKELESGSYEFETML